MKKYNLPLVLNFIILLAFYSCGSEAERKTQEIEATTGYTKLKDLNWLVGKWENRSPEGYAVESWEIINDSIFSGNSFFIVGKDTVSSEKIELIQTGETLLYVPTVKDQNNGKAVEFTMTSNDKGQWIFENPEHDFPQKITYTRKSNDSMQAEISGNIEGKFSSQQFPFSRAK